MDCGWKLGFGRWRSMDDTLGSHKKRQFIQLLALRTQGNITAVKHWTCEYKRLPNGETLKVSQEFASGAVSDCRYLMFQTRRLSLEFRNTALGSKKDCERFMPLSNTSAIWCAKSEDVSCHGWLVVKVSLLLTSASITLRVFSALLACLGRIIRKKFQSNWKPMLQRLATLCEFLRSLFVTLIAQIHEETEHSC